MIDRSQAWHELATAEATELAQPRRGLGHLPEPAERYLNHALPADGATVGPVVLDMEGEIKLKRWMPFRARQILHPDHGFVWNATVGRRPLHVRGGDSFSGHRGALEFRLWGLLPLVRAIGPDIDRSAAGRLVAETVVWAPQALHPDAGATWRAGHEGQAIVTRTVGGEPIEVTLTVDLAGRPRELVMQRWGDPDGEFGMQAFGASVTETGTFDGITVATAGTVGWHWGTDRQQDGEFFRYHVTNVVQAPARRPEG